MSDFVSAWETLFGTYAPIVITDANDVSSVMTDWGYVMRTGFFLLASFCVFKLIGGMLSHGKR